MLLKLEAWETKPELRELISLVRGVLVTVLCRSNDNMASLCCHPQVRLRHCPTDRKGCETIENVLFAVGLV